MLNSTTHSVSGSLPLGSLSIGVENAWGRGLNGSTWNENTVSLSTGIGIGRYTDISSSNFLSRLGQASATVGASTYSFRRLPDPTIEDSVRTAKANPNDPTGKDVLKRHPSK